MSTEYSHEFNSLLKGEISAVETYELAMQRDFDGDLLDRLNECRACHAEMVDLLTRCVVEAGGKPDTGSGPWGAFNKMVENTASTPRDALALLEQLEAEHLVQFEAQKEFLPPPVLEILNNQLLPMQHKTHLILSTALKQIDPTPTK